MHFYPNRLLKLLAFLIIFTVIYRQLHLYSLPSDFKHKSPATKLYSLPSNVEPISSKIELLRANISDDFSETSHTLQPFVYSVPHFVDDEARFWFLNSTYHQMYFKHCLNNSCEKYGFRFDELKEHREVHVAFVKNGLYRNDDCGFKYSDQALRRTFSSTKKVSLVYDQAIIYTVPDGWSFQHFLDGIGPKLSHSRVYLDKYPNAKVIVLQGIRFDRSVKEIWQALGVNDSNRLIHYKPELSLGARLLINPCRTPATHPTLWQDARRIYWSIANLSDITSRNKLIYLRRTAENSKNGGRLILNEEPLIEILRQYALKKSLEFIQYDSSKTNTHISKQIELFFHARIIIGVHGGTQSNINFAQSGTTVIEIMPYRAEQSTTPIVCRLSSPNELRPCVGYIYYVQAQLLNHSYWMLPTKANSDGNIQVNLTRLQRLFDVLT